MLEKYFQHNFAALFHRFTFLSTGKLQIKMGKMKIRNNFVNKDMHH